MTVLAQCLYAQWDDKFYHPDKEWWPVDSVNYEEIIFEADGDTLYSLLLKPATPPRATVLYFHGNGGNISKWIGHIKPLVSNGFQVCLFDYRGYGKSTGVPTHLNIASDAQRLFDTLQERTDVKEIPFIVYGASIGTQVATHLTKNNQKDISALILDGAMASFTDVAISTSPPEYHEMIRQHVTSPYSAREDIKEIKDIRLLMIHSREDAIPIEGAREVYESAPCPKQFWEYTGPHIQAPVLHPDTFIGYVEKLLKTGTDR